MTAKHLRIEQGGFIFEICNAGRHTWVTAELEKRWRAFVTDSSPVDFEVIITYYDPERHFNWPADRLKPFKKMFREVIGRFPFENSDDPTARRPEEILEQLDPDNRAVRTVGKRISQDARLIFANTGSGIYFFDPAGKELFVFVNILRPPLPLFSRFFSKLSAKRAGLVAEISNGVMLALSWLLIHDGGLLLHGAGVQKSGQAVLFLGLSGAGKSTVARTCAPDFCFSDDGVIIKRIETETFIFPSIFTQARGHLHQPLLLKSKLGKLFLLNKSDRNQSEPIDKNLLMNHILLHLIHFFRYFDEETAKKAFENTFEIVGELPAFKFDFTENREGWSDVWQAPEKRKNTNRRL